MIDFGPNRERVGILAGFGIVIDATDLVNITFLYERRILYLVPSTALRPNRRTVRWGQKNIWRPRADSRHGLRGLVPKRPNLGLRVGLRVYILLIPVITPHQI